MLSTPYVDGFKVAGLFFGSVAAGLDTGTLGTAGITAPAGFASADDDAGSSSDDAAASASAASAGPLILREVAATLEGAMPWALAPRTPAAAAACCAPLGAPFPHTRWGFRDGLEALTPEDFSTLQRCVKEETPNPSVKHLLALLRLGNHDAEVFYKFKQARGRGCRPRSAYPDVV